MPYAIYCNFGILVRLESRPQAQMTKYLKLKIIFALRPFQRALIYPILIAGTQVMQEKHIFLGKGPSQGQIPGL
jgi:hypothetical protein